MANQEYLKILKQGVKAWNEWRKQNPKIEPDLFRADLRGVNLKGADLSGAYLMEANLKGANLKGANLDAAHLSEADLTEANLIEANLKGVHLGGAHLIQAKLREANLKGAKLYGARLSEADLFRSDLSEAFLSTADLREASLSGADFSGADLNGTDLNGATLRGANLRGARLNWANLNNTELSYSDCRHSDLSNASLTGAVFYGVASFGWTIHNIECDYIYLDSNKTNRYPKDRDFELGEFERLYQSLPTIEMLFENGMTLLDPIALELAAKKITEKHSDWNLELRAIDKWGLYPRAVFTVSQAIEQAEKLLRETYKKEIENLRNDKRYLQNTLQLALQQPPRQITVGRDYYEAHGNIQITNIIQAVEEIRKAIEEAPEESFKDKSKKNILEHMNNIAKEATKESVKAVGKKLFDFAKTELVPIIPNIMTLLSQYLGTR